MERSFWLRKWEEGQIGFHQERVHPDLERFGSRFLGDDPQRVLVPLCGKTLDLGWLADQGHTVTGVELSEIAARSVFEARGEAPEITRHGPLTRYRSGRLTVWQGDLFEVGPEQLGPVDRIWDRAAMVALPPQMRARYVPHLRRLAGEGSRVLLNAFAYDTSIVDGPPFSVPEVEVRTHYDGAEVEILEQQDRIDEEPRWREKGLQSWLTTTYLIHL